MHETFAPLHAKDTNKCLLWHEGIAGRSASEVSSTYFKIITSESSDVSTFIFWADNCSAQNKNWTLYSALVMFVNSEWGPEKIIIKYFEPGHSFMKADSVHGNIGKEWSRRTDILNMDDVVNVIVKADKHNEVVHMTVTDFVMFKDGTRKRNKNDSGQQIVPLLGNIRICEFRKGSRMLYYKESFDDVTFNESTFLKQNFQFKLPEREAAPKGVNSEKKNKILTSLLPHMPARKRFFWHDLSSSDNAADMCKFSEE